MSFMLQKRRGSKGAKVKLCVYVGGRLLFQLAVAREKWMMRRRGGGEALSEYSDMNGRGKKGRREWNVQRRNEKT